MATYRYWQHFLALEADFATTTRYVELATENFRTYSTEYTKLLLATGSEIDVLCKVICEKLDPSAPRENIDDYRTCITAHTSIGTEEVLVRRYGLTFRPWEAWTRGENPPWWRSYNKVKHQRDVHFANASLGNCATAVSGLFVAVLYCHKAENSTSELRPYPILLGREHEPGHLLLESDYAIPAFS
jgi:hypothetical protein